MFKVRRFARDRQWEKFHNPKDLAIAVALEASELLEHFVWKTVEESEVYAREHKEELAEEIADVAIYLMLFCDRLGLDFLEIVDNKIEKNAKKYPISKAKGSAKKYTEYLDN